MRDMEGKICDIKWKSKVCHKNHNFEKKYTMLQEILEIVKKGSVKYALHSWTLVGLLVLFIFMWEIGKIPNLKFIFKIKII